MRRLKNLILFIFLSLQNTHIGSSLSGIDRVLKEFGLENLYSIKIKEFLFKREFNQKISF